MDNLDRLEKMLAGTDFMSFPDLTSEDPMKALEDHNQKQWDKLGGERSERVRSLIWAEVADKLHPMAMERYGNTGDSAVRSVLEEILNEELQQLESKQEWQEFVKDAQDCFVREEGMTPSKAEQCIKFCFIDYPVDLFANGIQRWTMLPRALSNQTVDVLTKMFQEATHANS